MHRPQRPRAVFLAMACAVGPLWGFAKLTLQRMVTAVLVLAILAGASMPAAVALAARNTYRSGIDIDEA